MELLFAEEEPSRGQQFGFVELCATSINVFSSIQSQVFPNCVVGVCEEKQLQLIYCVLPHMQ